MGDDTIKPPSDSWQLVPPGWTLVPPGGVRPAAPPPPRASWSPSPQDAYVAQLEQEIVRLKASLVLPALKIVDTRTGDVMNITRITRTLAGAVIEVE